MFHSVAFLLGSEDEEVKRVLDTHVGEASDSDCDTQCFSRETRFEVSARYRLGPHYVSITASLTSLPFSCLAFLLAALATISRANKKEQVQRVQSEQGQA